MPEKIFSNILDGTFHEISFLKKYSSLYGLLEKLLTRKTTVNSGNIDKIFLIINLMCIDITTEILIINKKRFREG